MLKGRNLSNANHFRGYLATPAAQDIYAGYGFLPAPKEGLRFKDL